MAEGEEREQGPGTDARMYLSFSAQHLQGYRQPLSPLPTRLPNSFSTPKGNAASAF